MQFKGNHMVKYKTNVFFKKPELEKKLKYCSKIDNPVRLNSDWAFWFPIVFSWYTVHQNLMSTMFSTISF